MKVFLAATSDKSFIPNITDSKYILESFYYFQDWQIPLIKKSEMFLLDSGAFTFMSGKKSNDFDGYLTRYIKFIKKYDVKYFSDLLIMIVAQAMFKTLFEVVFYPFTKITIRKIQTLAD